MASYCLHGRDKKKCPAGLFSFLDEIEIQTPGKVSKSIGLGVIIVKGKLLKCFLKVLICYDDVMAGAQDNRVYIYLLYYSQIV